MNRWLHRYACLLAGLTFLLIVAGASVTSNRAGLAVPDWPTSYGHHMFSFPLAKMVGGIFYEHGHRLLASIVGLVTTGLAIWTFFGQRDRLVRRLGLTALALVLIQGLLGGLTVIFFLPPPISIAHAALAQGFFCLTLALALVTSPRWQQPATETPRARLLQWLALLTTGLVYLQLILGATVRHADRAVLWHIFGAIAVFIGAGVAVMALLPSVRRRDFFAPAIALGFLIFTQLWVGAFTLVVRVPKADHGQLDPIQVWIPTLHLAIGAAILACSFVLTLKTWRYLRAPVETPSVPWGAYVDLVKPRIVTMVLVTTTLGYFLGQAGIQSWPGLILTLLGVGLATGGSAVLNNYLERDSDAKMQRTRHRALPAGLIEPQHALGLGVSLVLAGVLLLARGVNLLTAFLVLLATFLYVLVYTPLKKISWLNTTFGAIPGAIPPMAGWAAATGRVDVGAWVLFAILFVWQHPHFFAIAWMYRDDYRAAGFQMLPVVEPDGRSTFRQTILFSVLLIGVSLLPTLVGMTGWVYFIGALVMGLVLLATGCLFAVTKTFDDARRLLKASVIYLPLLLILIVADAGF